MELTIQIETLRPRESRAAAEFFQVRLRDTFSQTFPASALEKYARDVDEKRLKEAAEAIGQIVLVAKDESGIRGLMFGSTLNGGIASVIWIVVDPKLRGRGVGRRLMAETVRAYKDLGAHKLVLYTETTTAREFYEKVGMRHEGVHPNHWWGIDHDCLAIDLREPPVHSTRGTTK